MFNFVPRRLQIARVARGLTQVQMQDLTNIPANSLSKMEQGHIKPKMDHFEAMVSCLSVSPEFLMGGSSFAELDKEPSTGVFDCNGKELFSGNRVKCIEYNNNGTIGYWNGEYGFLADGEEDYTPLKRMVNGSNQAPLLIKLGDADD